MKKNFNYLLLAILLLLVHMPNNANAEELYQHEELLDVILTEIDFSGGLLDGKPILVNGKIVGTSYNATDNDISTFFGFTSSTKPTFILEKPANIIGYRFYGSSYIKIVFYVGDSGESVTVSLTNTQGEFVEYEINDVRKIEFTHREGLSRLIREFNVYGTYVVSLPPKVDGVTVSNITYNEADIVWNSVEDAEKYKIYLNNTLIGETTNNTYKLTNLNADTNYTVRVAAENENGEGPSSDPVSFRTLPLPVPSKVQNVTVKDITATSAVISWDANPENEGVLKYIVYLNNKKHGETTNTEYTLDNLQPATTYTVQIEAVNTYGAGPQSDPVEFTTLETPPDPATPVRNIAIKNMTSTSAVISWTPNPETERITKYIIYVNGEKYGETENTEYLIEGLKEGERYTVIVTAVNALGEGPPSVPIKFTPYKIADISTTIKVQDILSSIAVLFTNLWPLLAFALALIAVVPITTVLKQTIRRRSDA